MGITNQVDDGCDKEGRNMATIALTFNHVIGGRRKKKSLGSDSHERRIYRSHRLEGSASA
jgi:hypothetical protein